MRAPAAEQLRGGVCRDLPPAVIDEYWMADGVTERILFMTARAVCGQCAARRDLGPEDLLEPATIRGAAAYVEEVLRPDVQALVY